MPEPKRASYVRELRHDFRHWYHVSYDEVPLDEALDLARMLPDGSAYKSALDPHRAWTNEEHLLADICDQVSRMIQIYATRTTENAHLHGRPGDREAQVQDIKRARDVRRKIKQTKWREVDHGERGQREPANRPEV